jgi:hypothetical protein
MRKVRETNKNYHTAEYKLNQMEKTHHRSLTRENHRNTNEDLYNKLRKPFI